MEHLENQDRIFRESVSAIDAGNIEHLTQLLEKNASLVKERLANPGAWLRNSVGAALEGYFKQPYLLWFIADNPIRTSQLPSNITDVTVVIISCLKKMAPASLQEQLDYTLGLVATGRIPKECGVQIELMDLLINAGAHPGGGVGAIAHGNPEAAAHLISRGGKLTLPVAICLGLTDDIMRLTRDASTAELVVALAAAAFYGNAPMLTTLIKRGADVNAFPEKDAGFHSHATALHQAVYSASADAVRVLLEAGAKTEISDRIYNGTPAGWAEHLYYEAQDENAKKNFMAIINLLRQQDK